MNYRFKVQDSRGFEPAEDSSATSPTLNSVAEVPNIELASR